MQYKPSPIAFDSEELPAEISCALDWIGEQVHERWAEKRMLEGWVYGPQYDGDKKHHPCLIPYDQLPESEKEYDRSTARQTIQLLLHAGYRILPPRDEY